MKKKMKAEKRGGEADGRSLGILTWSHVRLAGGHGVCLDDAEESGNGDHSTHNTASVSQGSHLYLRRY